MTQVDTFPKSNHLDGLDGLRGLAAIAVVFSHLTFYYTIELNHGIGNYGVFIFFVLSGFLMSHLYLDKPADISAMAKYIGARVARIVPLYFVVVMASWFVGKHVDHEFVFKLTDFELARQLSFVGSKYVFWTIAPEIQFYILFGIFWVIWAARHTKGNRGVALFCLLGVMIVFSRTIWPGFIVFSKFHIFFAGVMLALFRRRVATQLNPSVIALLQIVSVAIMASMVITVWPDSVKQLIYPSLIRGDIKLSGYYDDFGKLLVMCLIVFSLSLPSRFSSQIFGSRVARAAGAYSFAIYLLHEPIIYCVRLWGSAYPPLTQILFILLSTWLVCGSVHHLFEKPALNWGRQLVARGIVSIFARAYGENIGKRI